MAGVLLRRRDNSVTVKLVIKGLEGFKKNLSNLAQLKGLDAELERSAQGIAATAAQNLSRMGAEKPGGKLASSLTVKSGNQEFSKVIGSDLKYASFVEFGTLRTPPKPWLSSALATEKPVIKNRISNLLLTTATSKTDARNNP